MTPGRQDDAAEQVVDPEQPGRPAIDRDLPAGI